MVTSKRGMRFQISEDSRIENRSRSRTSALYLKSATSNVVCTLNQRDFNSCLLQGANIRLGGAAVSDHFLQRRRWSDQGKAAAAEFAGVADGHRLSRDFDHHTIHFGFQEVRGAQAEVNVEAIDAQKQNVCTE